MNRLIEYTEVLQLDNFLQVLTFEERLQVNQYRAEHTDEIPERVAKLQLWIDQRRWQSPEFRYSTMLELLYFDIEKQAFQPIHEHELYLYRIIN